MPIPSQYLPVMPYLILHKSGEFLEFMKYTFNANEQMIVPGTNNDIMHGEVRIGEAVIMFAGATDQWGEKTAGMYIYVEKVDPLYQKALSKGAKTLMEPAKKDYGYTAGFEDPFGNQWWIVEV